MSSVASRLHCDGSRCVWPDPDRAPCQLEASAGSFRSATVIDFQAIVWACFSVLRMWKRKGTRFHQLSCVPLCGDSLLANLSCCSCMALDQLYRIDHPQITTCPIRSNRELLANSRRLDHRHYGMQIVPKRPPKRMLVMRLTFYRKRARAHMDWARDVLPP
jgi:hypothetical protein